MGIAAANVDVDICLTAFNYDILRRRARRELIPLAKAKDMTVVLGAVIRLPNDVPDPPANLRSISEESGISVKELTLRFLLVDGDVTQGSACDIGAFEAAR